MDIDAAIAWLESHIDHATWAARSARTGPVELSLDRMRSFVTALGSPQALLPMIHVTGTNGKGSTSRIITRLLLAEGLRVGTYSSPHLADYTERFRLDDRDIEAHELAGLLTRMAAAEEALGERMMPFELLTAAAYTLFAERNVDVAVVEVGVLGRYDATNVADGRVAVITNIGFDHTSGDGDWQLRIASEKAGIIKPGAHLVLGAVDPRFDDCFTAQQPGVIWKLTEQIIVTADEPTVLGRIASITTPWQHLDDLVLPLRGAHQTRNCALALTAASAFLGRALDPHRVQRALAAVSMPGRLEPITVAPGGPTILLDGAHNPDAARALAAALDEMPNGRSRPPGHRVLVIGLLNGRDPATMLEAVRAVGYDTIIACTPPTERARPAEQLRDAARALGCEAVAFDVIGDALRTAIDTAGPTGEIVVTGSIYLVADARSWLLDG